MKKYLFIILVIMCITTLGCENKKEEEIYIRCDDTETNLKIKEGTKYNCTLLTTEYEFTFKKID